MSGISAIYSAFLQSPSTSQLSNDAALHYITTTTSISEPTAILKHITAQKKQVTTKEQKVLNAIEGPDNLFLETETTLQFSNGGGAYLPSMDENLLDEKLVTFPLLHVVSFNEEQKIKQIRLHWDLSTLLKQVEAIGRTGRNWPIRDGRAQIETISKSLKSTGINPDKQPPLPIRGPNEIVIQEHRKRESVSATRDPHASLALFAPRDPNENTGSTYEGPKVSTRESAKPAPRDYGELFANSENDSPAAGGKIRSPSPTKSEGVFAKGGAGKNHFNNRLFEPEESNHRQPSPERKKTYHQKYQHFDFGDGEDAPETRRPTSSGRGNKSQPSFSFEDFHTPPKVTGKARRDDERHWGGEEDPPSPPKRPVVNAARKDADTHFQFADQGPPSEKKQVPIHREKGMGLYKDPLAFEDDQPITSKHHTERASMNQHWGHGTPEPNQKIYKTAGDGLGGRAGARSWGIGSESDPEEMEANANSRGRGRQHAKAGASDF